MPGNETEERYNKLEKAFETDGFAIIKKAFTAAGRIGILAQHMNSKNYDTGQKKKSYYIEGTPYERGFLLGLLAEPEISDMAANFSDKITFDFFGTDLLSRSPAVRGFFVYAVNELSRRAWPYMPRHIHDELSGMIYGCGMANRNTSVTENRLVTLNMGLDALCALVYSGRFEDVIPQLLPESIQLPMLCNAFSAFGSVAPCEHFFGHDFTLGTKGALGSNLTHIITLPDDCGGKKLYPYLSVGAPGLLGSFSVMNMRGVAGGLNMSPAANCDPDNVGFNSLLLLRESVMRGSSAAEAADIIQNAKRGVSWNYVLSDESNDTACTAEAGVSKDDISFLSYPDKELLEYLPDSSFLSSNVIAPVNNGCAVRWCGLHFPDSYFQFNSGLWEQYNSKHDKKVTLNDDAFLPGGYINPSPADRNCPGTLYFAPLRTGEGVHITTNHFLMPQMRLCAMRPWTGSIANRYVNDTQWRYDELNHQIREFMENGGVDYDSARRLIDFLAPSEKFPDYYSKKPKSRFGNETRTEGCTTLFDLKKKTAESRYGCYCDDWIKITLPAYFETE